MSSFSGRSAIIFRTPKVSSRLVAELVSCLRGFAKIFRECALRAAKCFADGLAIAKARLPDVELYQMDARHIPFEREFDVVGAFDVLEHIIEDENALAQMFNAARPGGDC